MTFLFYRVFNTFCLFNFQFYTSSNSGLDSRKQRTCISFGFHQTQYFVLADASPAAPPPPAAEPMDPLNAWWIKLYDMTLLCDIAKKKI